MNREQQPASRTDSTEKPLSLADVLFELKARLPDPSQPDLADQRERFNAAAELSRKVGHRLAYCSFQTYQVTEETAPNRPSQRDVWTQIESFAWDLPARTRIGGGLVLFGRPGCGKDHLAVAAGYVGILQHGYSVQWIHGLELFELARRLIRVDGDETAFVRDFVRPKILIVSDPIPPKGDASQYNADVLMRIVDRRYRESKSTWFTLNVLDGEEAERRLASPIVDRVRHGSLCLECNWPSYRTPAAR
jgi:DNA replication protein DnaC